MTISARAIRTTNKGLITERHGLVFDPDSTVDELNCEILVSQIRRRRKGIQYETDYSLSTFTHTEGEVISEATWENVGGVPSLKFLVVQSGDTLYFYDKSSSPISGGLKSFSVDLQNFDAPNDKVLTANGFQGSSLDGVFVVAHPGCDLFYITYDVVTDTISTTQFDPKVRDFDWQGDVEDYLSSSASSSVSVEREYDTKNAGWDDDAVDPTVTKPLITFVTAKGNYPALTKPWHAGKNASDLFSQLDWDKVWSGTTLSGNGHYILDFFSKNREQYVTGAGIENETSRFSAVTSFAGRFWYAGLESANNSGKVLFTKVIQTDSDYEHCYQTADPTAEDISDLIDTDGGEINIPAAYGIKRLYDFGASLLVFAENGVWEIRGVDGVFKATEYSVSKVTNFGLFNKNTFVDAAGIPFWWSSSGIHTISSDQVSQSAREQNITRQSIQTFWDNISRTKKLQVKSAFDEENQKIYWMYPNNTETVDYKYNRFLILDLTNKAFVPWTVGDQDSSTNYIVGMSYFPAYGASEQTQTVTVNGDVVTENAVTVTWTSGVTISATDSQMKFIVRDGATGKFTIAYFADTDFVDWGSVNYSSYFKLGYDGFESFSLEKTPVTLVTYFERTEDGWTSNGDGSYNPTNPSGCTVKSFWDFKTNQPNSQSVYRLHTLPVVDDTNLTTFNYPTTVIINRTRLRGGGNILSLQFDSENGKEFRFMGYELVFDKHDQL